MGSSANSKQSRGLIVRAMEKYECENPMRAIEVEKLVLNDRVGTSGARSARGEKAVQRVEKA